MVDITSGFARIQRQALDSAVPVADTLRLCIALGGQLGSPELIEWAKCELNGYAELLEVPQYRRVHAPVFIDYINGHHKVTGQVLPRGVLDDEIYDTVGSLAMQHPLHEIAKLAAEHRGDDAVHMLPPGEGHLRQLIDYGARKSNPYFSVISVYVSVNGAVLDAIVDQVRTKLVEMVAVFDAESSARGASLESAAERAVSVVAPGATIHFVNAPGGTAVSGSDRAIVTANSAGGELVAATAGGDVSSLTTTAPDHPARFWETAWWTVGKVIVGAISLMLVAATAWFAYLAVQ
ncbi:MAG TPA: hypothetical protein DHV14_14570 [Micrococcales bacterium]|uniref:AbiTii domain-containing protein n=1 Tax=Miniimonas arenae TaxID=676201 RepID=UPI000ED7BC2D|nr:hypothetical protein [Miniimonas arenae]HCX86325.1 hypothetical protein [Micrococcales bacterium]